MTLTPAYGRTYTNKANVLADFNANKDFLRHFMTEPVKPINKEQITSGTRVQFRYGAHGQHVFGHVVEAKPKSDREIAFRNYTAL